ncbi:MAG: cold shock domain-containing protein [Bryobacteraceae bacterium]|jgi:CspA family cold shock protein
MRQKGTVRWFDAAKGYGFITRDTGGRDVFVYQTAIQMEGFRTLEEADRVEFEVMDDAKGPRAVNVTVIPER